MKTHKMIINDLEKPNLFTPFLITSLLILRIPFFGFLSLFISTLPVWLVPTYELSTYLLTACLIYLERDHLTIYHIDRWTLVLFIISRTLFYSSQYNTIELIAALGSFVIALTMLIMLMVRKSNIPKRRIRDWVWVPISILPFLLLGYLIHIFRDITRSTLQHPQNILLLFVAAFVYALGHAAVSEEPLFRGFLWGYLRKIGWVEGKVLLLQGLLFWFAHINYIHRLSFWTSIPIIAMVLGIMVWKSRSVAVGMLVHASYNALGIFLQ